MVSELLEMNRAIGGLESDVKNLRQGVRDIDTESKALAVKVDKMDTNLTKLGQAITEANAHNGHYTLRRKVWNYGTPMGLAGAIAGFITYVLPLVRPA